MSASTAAPGVLVLAATPLGDPRDASVRLRELIGTADVIAAEDTRRFRTLAAALGVTYTGKIVSHYDAVESERAPGLLAAVRDGATVLVVSDAGMPAVSDPGYRLVAAAAAEDLPVTCLPGPSAVTTALVLSGLPAERFCFEGFPPRRPGERRRWLETLRDERRAVVFFESPRRTADLLRAAVEVLGPDRRAAVCRELTKTYEQVRRGTLAELAEWAASGDVLGEVTMVLAGAEAGQAPPVASLVDAVRERVDDGERLKDAVAAVAEAAGVPKRDLYNATLAARDS
ncbi:MULTISPECIES: 16S rRNA (cytidine(1402)-2'-O)-methyltransferase [Pseudonocardia]|uniref:Ribosomal RNA small subunit methyltransferase I n=2 Tax=Pseudonocardia TaxID=1847 RepID=A0A1Y2MRA4_PSEAH|nr:MULTISPECIES: 16S rRNA (cytidine(1402)-2'-O)-methyltransferase [Pseudonocardia]OSY37763.1 Ribosomal RNA small subunit methyltransferase I [Pseudonocardia autotrophica]TDN75747.1 16S rRNA (cytidine1402-2'-O)-methyltransferase [Pseudonocardia autotrophica]BBF99717.1 ribosomal RNA small subunit methyltransferase I [Pseudonocardia autotrophica]GEC27192.1 ribosomal RNA small subunit methyltransferase I [Pseudonocardia saturnea]